MNCKIVYTKFKLLKSRCILKFESTIRHCAHSDMCRWLDVHGAEEALLSAHLATGLAFPPLEVVLWCTKATQSGEKWSDDRKPFQRWVQLAEDDGYGYCMWEGMRTKLYHLFLAGWKWKETLIIRLQTESIFMYRSSFDFCLFSFLGLTARLATFYGSTI